MWLGSALLFLLPNEDSYVEFLSINQKVGHDDLKAIITHYNLLWYHVM